MLSNLLKIPIVGFNGYVNDTVVTIFGMMSNFIGITKQISLIKN